MLVYVSNVLFVCLLIFVLFLSFQLSVQKQLKMLQEENRALQQALDHAPSLAQLEEAHKQIGSH